MNGCYQSFKPNWWRRVNEPETENFLLQYKKNYTPVFFLDYIQVSKGNEINVSALSFGNSGIINNASSVR